MVYFYCSKVTILTLIVYNILVFYIISSSSEGNPIPAITDVSSKPLWNATETDLIKKALLRSYDKFSRPAQHTKSTTVILGLSVLHVEIDERKSTFSIFCWTKFTWTDEKLKWNASDYGGLKLIRLADHEIWQPDVVVYNGADGNSIDHYGSTHLIVFNDGTVIWVPPSQFNVFCDLNYRYWPFDTQTCTLKMGSWTYDGNSIDLQMSENSSEIELLLTNSEWKLTKLRKARKNIIYACCEEPYPHIAYNFTVVRNSPTYRAIVVTPAFVVVFLTLSTFWLPPQSGEKILLNGCVAVINCLILMYLTHKIPPLRLHVPLVVLFFTNNLYMVCFSTIISVIVIHTARTKHNVCLPWFIKKLLTGWLGRMLGLQISNQSLMPHRVNAEELREHSSIVFDDHNGSDDHQMISSSTKKISQQDWLSFATAIDRISFVLYTFIYVILAIMYSF